MTTKNVTDELPTDTSPLKDSRVLGALIVEP